jgi:hypothetical protein
MPVRRRTCSTRNKTTGSCRPGKEPTRVFLIESDLFFSRLNSNYRIYLIESNLYFPPFEFQLPNRLFPLQSASRSFKLRILIVFFRIFAYLNSNCRIGSFPSSTQHAASHAMHYRFNDCAIWRDGFFFSFVCFCLGRGPVVLVVTQNCLLPRNESLRRNYSSYRVVVNFPL